MSLNCRTSRILRLALENLHATEESENDGQLELNDEINNPEFAVLQQMQIFPHEEELVLCEDQFVNSTQLADPESSYSFDDAEYLEIGSSVESRVSNWLATQETIVARKDYSQSPSNQQDDSDVLCQDQFVISTQLADPISTHSFVDEKYLEISSSVKSRVPSLLATQESIVTRSNQNLQDDSDFVPTTENDSDTEGEDEETVVPLLPDQMISFTDLQKQQQKKEQSVEVAVDIEVGDNMSVGKKRSRKANRQSWKKNVIKKMRMEGKAYVGYSRSNQGVVKNNVARNERKMGEPCKSKACLKSKNKNCSRIGEETRMLIFKKFWSNMNWEQRKVFVVSHVARKAPTRRYTEGPSRRNSTMVYSFTVGDKKIEVCKHMFLSTLNIGEYTVHSWIKKSQFGMCTSTAFSNQSRKKTFREGKEQSKLYLKEFFISLPKLPSHYGRHDSSKLYLEQTVHSMSQLFKLYLERCTGNLKLPVSRTAFTEMFYSMNLSLYQIKKDKCDVCTQHEVGNLPDDKWDKHVVKKNRARLEKTNDKEAALKNECRLLTMDLQAVKVSPCLQASSIFFKTKLSCHNFTVYDLASHHTTCFWFTETEADLTASTFATCIIEYLNKNCANELLPIILFSDGCTYQNRNNVLSNALLSYAVDNKVIIMQKYLEPGHTQMECDSVHSCIERKLKGREIHLPSDYLTISKEARSKPFPCDVKSIEYHQFKDYTEKSFHRYSTIRPGKVARDPVVTDIRAIKYTPDGKIVVKLDFDGEWQELPHRAKNVPSGTVWPPLYKEQRKIKNQKWKHLQELKSVIPADCHYFYDSLPHETN